MQYVFEEMKILMSMYSTGHTRGRLWRSREIFLFFKFQCTLTLDGMIDIVEHLAFTWATVYPFVSRGNKEKSISSHQITDTEWPSSGTYRDTSGVDSYWSTWKADSLPISYDLAKRGWRDPESSTCAWQQIGIVSKTRSPYRLLHTVWRRIRRLRGRLVLPHGAFRAYENAEPRIGGWLKHYKGSLQELLNLHLGLCLVVSWIWTLSIHPPPS